ncbi:solute carrier family 25 member 44 isoform X6 [Nannospalax galili]|uniref:solute carrier family 25 member 44 isoform X6 n=1 Tax=Nannospalax galili TaxID=1026970 RepID=UPI000819DE8E|nr:solute carrier family 25 member 44 isoform X6 [Nannospalax galili]
MARGMPEDRELAVREPDRRSSDTMEDKRNIQIIEWEHLDKKKFYVFGVAMTMMIRVSVYPFTLIRTRLQVQKGKSLYHGTFDAFVKILKADGVTGLYRGFLVNTFTLISEQLSYLCPKECPHIVFQAISGPLAAATASILTNPMDVIRTRVQVEGKSSIILTFKQLMAEEGPWGLMKGLSARIISATPSTIVIVVGYESLKKLSLRPELVDSRHW